MPMEKQRFTARWSAESHGPEARQALLKRRQQQQLVVEHQQEKDQQGLPRD